MSPRSPLFAVCLLLAGMNGPSRVAAQNGQVTAGEIDDCGVLVQGPNCVLFSGGGGKFVLADYGGYKVGDAVRVVGTIDPNCTTICADADGCISGAQVYNPATYPCGTALPNFPGDIISNACTSAAGALSATMLVGLWLTRPRRRP